MTCYNPLTAWQSPQVGLLKRPLHFVKIDGYTEIQIPCGQCIGCRLERSRQWAVRCCLESFQYMENVFITLTYDNEHLPKDLSLSRRVMQLFIKKLRKNISETAIKNRKENKKIKYYLCGEYGELYNRPHYHICLFNHDFKDKILWFTKNNIKIYRSMELERIWENGICTCGDVNFETAAYTARYCTKKITGANSGNHYEGKMPEYNAMSLRPGIGKIWWDEYKNDVLQADRIIIRNNLTCRPPKYYDKLTEKLDKLLYLSIKKNRKEKTLTIDRSQLLIKEQITTNHFHNLKRTYENGTS